MKNDAVDLFSTLITALLAAFIGFHFAKRTNKILRLQDELHSDRKNLSNLLSHSPFIKIVINLEGVVLFVNSTAYKYFKKCDLAPSHPLKLFTTEECEVTLPLINDEEGSFEVSTTSIRWNSQPAILLSLNDITKQKKLEQLREDVDRMVRHDMRSPLNGIVGLCDLMLNEGNLSSQQEEYLTMIADSGRKLADMIQKSLVLLQIELGTYQCPGNLVDVRRVVNEVVSMMLTTFQDRRICWAPSAPGTDDEVPLYVRGDKTLLYMLVANLVKNALEATSSRDEIRVEIFTGDSVRLCVENPGVIPREVQDHFFDKYFTYGKNHGSGLGTYMAKRIAQALGGNIRLENSSNLVRITADFQGAQCTQQESNM